MYSGHFHPGGSSEEEICNGRVGVVVRLGELLLKYLCGHLHTSYTRLGMLLQLYWKYLHRNVTKFGILMGPIESSHREALLTALFGVEEVNYDK